MCKTTGDEEQDKQRRKEQNDLGKETRPGGSKFSRVAATRRERIAGQRRGAPCHQLDR